MVSHIRHPDNAMVINSKNKRNDVKQKLVDGGSLSNLMFLNTLERVGNTREDLKRIDSLLFRLAK